MTAATRLLADAIGSDEENGSELARELDAIVAKYRDEAPPARRPMTHQQQLVAEAIADAIEAIEHLAVELHNAAGTDDRIRRFNAYHLADLEGAGAEWLGGPYLIDALRELAEPATAPTDEGDTE